MPMLILKRMVFFEITESIHYADAIGFYQPVEGAEDKGFIPHWCLNLPSVSAILMQNRVFSRAFLPLAESCFVF